MNSRDKFTLYVHIGSGKTGSSSIQKTLNANFEALEKSKMLYCGLMFENSLSKTFDWQITAGWPQLISQGKDVASAQLSEAVQTSIEMAKQEGYHSLIWSNESLFGNEEIVIPALNSLNKSEISVVVICYIRRHESWIQSAYVQWGLKHKTYKGKIKSFREWYQPARVQFSKTLAKWKNEEWDSLIIKNFEACGDVTESFLKLVGVPGIDKNIRDNDSPSEIALALWSLFNNQSEDQILPSPLYRVLNESNLLRNEVNDIDLSTLMPTVDDLIKVQNDADEDRDELNKTFISNGEPTIDDKPVKAKKIDVSQNQINAALLMIIKNQSDSINTLRRRIRMLDKKIQQLD